MPPDPSNPSDQPHSRIYSWPHVYKERHLFGIRIVLSASVIVDHVSDVGAAAVDDPVVPVKWGRVSRRSVSQLPRSITSMIYHIDERFKAVKI